MGRSINSKSTSMAVGMGMGGSDGEVKGAKVCIDSIPSSSTTLSCLATLNSCFSLLAWFFVSSARSHVPFP